MTPKGWDSRLIEGDAIQIGERELVPVAELRSFIRRQVTFGTQNSSGGGGGLIWLRPAHVIVRSPDGSEEVMPVPDETWTTIRSFLKNALAWPIIYLIVAILASVWRQQRQRIRKMGGET